MGSTHRSQRHHNGEQDQGPAIRRAFILERSQCRRVQQPVPVA